MRLRHLFQNCNFFLRVVSARISVTVDALLDSSRCKHYDKQYDADLFSFLFSEAFDLLLAKGSDVGSQDHQQSTPLHLAVQAGALEIVRRLLNPMLPSTLEIRDADQNSPLLIACMHNRLDVLKLLLDKGADVSARNKDCMNCLDVAIEWDSIQVARTLVKHERFVPLNPLLI